MDSKKAEELRFKANKCMNEKNYAEALLHYTHGIKFDDKSSKLFCNRSLAFLRLQQYYYAIEDAKQTIILDKHWFKGYYRKAEVEAECGHYEEAIKSYHLALHYLNESNSKNENTINFALKKAINNSRQQNSHDYVIPWIGAALGLVCGMSLITWDYVYNYSLPVVRHPMIKLLIIGFVSFVFFYLAKLQRKYTKTYRDSLLKPPLDIFND